MENVPIQQAYMFEEENLLAYSIFFFNLWCFITVCDKRFS